MLQALHRLGVILRLAGPWGAVRFVTSYLLGGWAVPLRVRGLGRTLLCRPRDSDPYSLRQIFVDRELDVALARQPRVIVDAGANVGYTTALLATRYPEARVVAIEPDGENCRLLRANCAGLRNVEIIQGALWMRDEPVRIVTRAVRSWSFRVEAGAGAESVRGISPATLLRELGTERIGLFKIDIEGAEAEVFADAVAWIERADALIIETHGEPAREAVLAAVGSGAFTIWQNGERLILELR